MSTGAGLIPVFSLGDSQHPLFLSLSYTLLRSTNTTGLNYYLLDLLGLAFACFARACGHKPPAGLALELSAVIGDRLKGVLQFVHCIDIENY